MTVPTQDNPPVETVSNKEINFRKQEQALKEHYERQLQQERIEKEQLRQQLQTPKEEDDDDDTEVYVDKKKLNKKLQQFGQQTQKQTQSEIQNAVQMAIREERKQNWLRQNADFDEVLQHADKLASMDPELAETILEMPQGFERQKLVYKSIKSLGLHKPPEKKPSIQDTIEANRRHPGYQPSGAPSGGFTSQADFSPAGQKAAYEKMQELKSRLNLNK